MDLVLSCSEAESQAPPAPLASVGSLFFYPGCREGGAENGEEDDFGVHIRSNAGGKEYFLSNHHESQISAITVDPTGKWLASVSTDALTLWDIDRALKDFAEGVTPCGRRLPLIDRGDFGFEVALCFDTAENPYSGSLSELLFLAQQTMKKTLIETCAGTSGRQRRRDPSNYFLQFQRNRPNHRPLYY
jgi:hypothetical protein